MSQSPRARVDPGQTGQRDDAARASASARLPMFPEIGPRVPLLELVDVRGGPIMAQGRGAPLDLRLMVAACILTPHAARASLGAALGLAPGPSPDPRKTHNSRRARVLPGGGRGADMLVFVNRKKALQKATAEAPAPQVSPSAIERVKPMVPRDESVYELTDP